MLVYFLMGYNLFCTFKGLLSLEGGGREAGKEREGVLGGKKHKANIWRLENACCVLGTVSLPFIQSNHPEFLGL